MKNLLFGLALLGSTLTLPAQSPSDEAAIRDFTRQFMTAYNAGDHAALKTMYTEDAERIDPEGAELKGAEEIAAYFAGEFRGKDLTLLVRHERLGWSDREHAWMAHGSYQVYGQTIVYDRSIDVSGHYANVMAKENGEWKIVKSMLSSQPDNAAVIDGLYQAFAQGDIPAALAPMAADIVWNEAESFPYADRNPYVGPNAVLEGVFARIGAEWEYWNLTDIELHAVGDDKILATLRYDAKHKQTGKVLDAQTAHLWTLKDGKIVAFQQYTDTRQAGEVIR